MRGAVGMETTRRQGLGPEPFPPQRCRRDTLLWSLALYALLAFGVVGALPLWALPVLVPLVYVRLALALHEMMHRCHPAGLPVYFRLAVVLETPWALGYREHRLLHFRHHRFNAGPGDPELRLIAAPPLLAFWLACTVPERSTLAWVREKGLIAVMGPGFWVRAVLFLAVAWASPLAFLAYWLSLRLSIGASGFCFHHVLHSRQGRLGTFALPGGAWTMRGGRWLFGRAPMLILARHRAHHLWPSLAVDALPDLPDDLELPPGQLSGVVKRGLDLWAEPAARSCRCNA